MISQILNLTFFFANEQGWNFSPVLAFSNFHLLQSNLMPQNTIISIYFFYEIVSLANFEILSRRKLKDQTL